ncbi:hypothetical protein [Nocardia nova]|uniref:hypothetical protein n=1 Tax=Nocardia nova TaxID=37330 RepID=UPI0018935B82|nr:hypothetical protein [Nocardia nova]MBF6277030.1 hypothetical protein [Nocardia nova]
MPEPTEPPQSLRALALTITAGVTQAMGEVPRMNVADVGLAAATIQGAAVLTLVHAGDQIRELVEQQKLTNVIAALTMDADRTPLNWDTESAAQDYIQARIGDIVNPRPESENQQ